MPACACIRSQPSRPPSALRLSFTASTSVYSSPNCISAKSGGARGIVDSRRLRPIWVSLGTEEKRYVAFCFSWALWGGVSSIRVASCLDGSRYGEAMGKVERRVRLCWTGRLLFEAITPIGPLRDGRSSVCLLCCFFRFSRFCFSAPLPRAIGPALPSLPPLSVLPHRLFFVLCFGSPVTVFAFSAFSDFLCLEISQSRRFTCARFHSWAIPLRAGPTISSTYLPSSPAPH